MDAEGRKKRDDLILQWMPLARRIAASESRRLGGITRILSIDVEDLYQSGLVGLIRGAAMYKPELCAPQTYFTRRIRGAICDFLRSFPHFDVAKEGARGFLSLDTPEEDEAKDLAAALSVMDPEFERAENRLTLGALMRRLCASHKPVIFGMMRGTPQVIIARRLGVTEGRVSQMRLEAISFMRRAARAA